MSEKPSSGKRADAVTIRPTNIQKAVIKPNYQLSNDINWICQNIPTEKKFSVEGTGLALRQLPKSKHDMVDFISDVFNLHGYDDLKKELNDKENVRNFIFGKTHTTFPIDDFELASWLANDLPELPENELKHIYYSFICLADQKEVYLNLTKIVPTKVVPTKVSEIKKTIEIDPKQVEEICQKIPTQKKFQMYHKGAVYNLRYLPESKDDMANFIGDVFNFHEYNELKKELNDKENVRKFIFGKTTFPINEDELGVWLAINLPDLPENELKHIYYSFICLASQKNVLLKLIEQNKQTGGYYYNKYIKYKLNYLKLKG